MASLGELVVNFVAKGFANVKTQVERLRLAVVQFASTFDSIGTKAAIGFAAATAAIGKFVSSADPVGFKNFRAELEILQIEIGRIFIPILRQVTNWIAQVRKYFESLSDVQRQQIVDWVRITLVVLGVGVAVSKLGSVFSGLIPIIKGVFATFSLLLGASPLGWIVAAVAGVVGLVAAFNVLEGSGKGLLDTLQDAFKGLLEAAKPIFDALVNLVRTVLTALQPVFDALVNIVMGVFERIKPSVLRIVGVFQDLLPKLMPIFDAVGRIVGTLVQAVGDVVVALFPVVEKIVAVVAGLLPRLAPIFEAVAAIIEKIIPPIVKLAEIVGESLAESVAAVVPFAESWIDGFGRVLNIVSNFVSVVIDIFNDVITTIGEIVSDLGLFDSAMGDSGIAAQVYAAVIDAAVWSVKALASALIAMMVVSKHVWSAIKDFVKNVVEAFKILAKINLFDPRSWKKGIKEAGEALKTAFDKAAEDLDPSTIGAEIADKISQLDKKAEVSLKTAAAKEKKDKESKEGKPTESFTPAAFPKKPELLGIGEAMRKAQTAQTDDPRLKVAQKHLELQKEANKKLDKIAEGVNGPEPQLGLG